MDLVSYKPLFWLVLVPVLGAFLARSLVDRRWALKTGAFALRAIGVVLIVLALCRPFVAHEVHQAHVVFLVDVSESVAPEAREATVQTVREGIEGLRSGDTWSLLQFAAEARETDPDALAKAMPSYREGLGDSAFRGQSRIAQALLAARRMFLAGKAKRIVLLTDGRETAGGLDEALKILRDERVDLVVHDLQSVTFPEVSVVSLSPNTPTAYFGEKVRLTVTLSSNRDTTAKLRIYCRGVLEKETPVRLEGGKDNRIGVDVAMSTPGSTVWAAELVAPEDHFPMNNRASCTVDVKGRAKVLILHGEPRRMRALARALSKQGIDADVRGARGLPVSLNRMLEFDAIVLANVPATTMTTRQMLNLKRYVSDFGGGLVMMGSKNSFGLGGYYQTPIEEVLPIVSRYEKEKERPSMAMVLVIDKSGSMTGLPIALARQAAKASVELISPRDKIGVIAFDGQPYVVCDMRPGSDANAICETIDQIAAGGGTNMYPAMQKGMDMLENTSAKIKHMIVLGDGQSMPGPFENLAGDMAGASMTVSTVALGEGADRHLMQLIARVGRGRYYETMDPSTVPRIFTKETVEASRSAIREEPFAPVKVGDADVIAGFNFDNVPLLLGYVMTRGKPTAEMQLITEAGDPLLALGRYGLGRSVAFTSDASDTWAGQWVQWRDFGRFWAQVLRACVRKTDSTGVTVKRQKHWRQIRFLIASEDQAGKPLDGQAWDALVIHDSGLRVHPTVREVGLGLYEVAVDRPKAGSFALRLHEPESRKLKVLHHHENYPKEYRLTAKRPEALARLPRLKDASPVSDLAAVSARVPVQNHMLIAALGCLLMGILLRRI
ncbi:MAG: VWA domain-containing protein [Candidatus Brocadiia bacterium]|nr:VWA domain-containing protein [Candidatus Brocadiia bacterium]